MNSLEGVGVALVTPFDSNNKIDYEAITKLLHHTQDADYWVISGTTGEAPTTTEEEKIAILKHVVKCKNSDKTFFSKQIVLGVGGNNTYTLVKHLQKIDLSDVDAVLSVTPYYNKPTQAGMIKHFHVLAEESEKPILLYNVPSRTGVNLEINTIVELSKHENIIGIKEADDDLNKINCLFAANIKDFKIISGTDSLTYEFVSNGGVGIISVLANAIPNAFLEIIKNIKEGEDVKALTIQESLLPLNAYMYLEGNPTGIKSLLNHLGICSKKIRLPMITSTKKLDNDIVAQYIFHQNSCKV